MELEELLIRAGSVTAPAQVDIDRFERRRHHRSITRWTAGAVAACVIVVASVVTLHDRGRHVVIPADAPLPTAMTASPGPVDAELQGIAQTSRGVFAYGYGIWRRSNGAWSKVFTSPSPESSISSLVETSQGLVAGGIQRVNDVNLAGIWTSTDGQRWTTVSDPRLVNGGKEVPAGGFPPQASVDGLSSDGETVIAVGAEFVSRWRGVAWRSNDLSTWTPVELGSINDASPSIRFSDVVRSGGEWLIGGSANGDPRVWRSSNMANWTTDDFPGSGGSTANLALAVSGDREVAVGQVDGHAVAWTHVRGKPWAETYRDAGSLDTYLTGVGASQSGFVASGRRMQREPFTDLIIVVSDDGLHWTPIGAGGTVEMSAGAWGGVQVIDGQFTVVGYRIEPTVDWARYISTFWTGKASTG